MFKIETETLIYAPLEQVWNCLTDTKGYPTWNQFIKKVEGDFIENQKVKIELHFPNNKVMTFKPTCTTVKNNSELRWVGTFLWSGLFKGEHFFILEKITDHTTKLIQAEVFTGLLANYFKKTQGPVTEEAFNIMNTNLADRFKTEK